MTRERFAEILKEYKFNENQISMLWRTRPPVPINEERLRKTAEHIAPMKDTFIQE